MLRINIPKPCHEDWNEMTTTDRGAFCQVCTREVVDFTNMSDEEVQNYLLNKAGEKTCGKFSNHQLDRVRVDIPDSIFYSKIAGWKKFMAVVMIVFGNMIFGCKDPEPVVGTVTIDTSTVKTPKDSVCSKDSIQDDYTTMGMVAPSPVKKDSSHVEQHMTTKGEIVYTPEKKDTTKKIKKDTSGIKKVNPKQ